jgi:hypothetical protein
MKRLFFYLLKKYSKQEDGRIEILSELQKSVDKNYSEQTVVGNVYNFYTEFLLSSVPFRLAVKSKDNKRISMIKGGLNKAFIESYEFIDKKYSTEIINHDRQEKINKIL